MNILYLQIGAAFFGLAGSIILAYCINQVLAELKFGLELMNNSIAALAEGRPVPIFVGIGTRIERAQRLSTVWVSGAVVLPIVSFLCAGAAMYLSSAVS